MALSTDAIFGILLGLVFFVAIGFFAFKIPGFLGMLLGFISSGLFAIGTTLWSLIGQFLAPVMNEVRKALAFSIAMPITFGAITVGQFIVSKIIAWNAVRTASAAGIQYIGPATAQLTLKGIIAGIKAFAKGAIAGAVVELLVSAGLHYLGVPQAIDNWAGGPVKFQTPLGEGTWSWGGATSGAISGAAGGAVMGSIVPVIGTAIGAGIGALVGFITGGLFG
jgi:hypothetical protein